MKYATDFRYIARESLRGNWLITTLTALMASLIGALDIGSDGIPSDVTERINLSEYFSVDIIAVIKKVLIVILVFTVVQFIITLVIGGAGKLGYARFNLNLIDGKKVLPADLFSQFHRLKDGFLMNVLMTVYIILWSLLFIIPGVIKSYSYAMTPYVLSEHPEYNPNYAIALSSEMMDGQKFRLFCLDFSFFGWSLLCMVPSMIAVVYMMKGNFLLMSLILVSRIARLILCTYKEAAQAAFYREISKGYNGIT